MLPPACNDPQDIVVILVVQALSEYTPIFGEVATFPDVIMSWLTVMTASVLAVKENAITVKTIVRIFCILCDAMCSLLYDEQ